MLTPRKLETFCRWWSKEAREQIDSARFFVRAYCWKYGSPDQMQMAYAYHAYMQSGYIPEYVEEYWRKFVVPFLIVGARRETHQTPPKATGARRKK